jgi:hypothetical protein
MKPPALLVSGDIPDFMSSVAPKCIPEKNEAMENLACYIIRASFSQERMTSLPDETRCLFRSKDNRQEKAFDALGWLAAMTSHIPDHGEEITRYYCRYSNVPRGLRQKENMNGVIPYLRWWNSLISSTRNC